MTKPIIAGGGVIFSKGEKFNDLKILLILRNGLWDLPKGKLEKGESIPMCAAREVAEETGSEIPIIISELGTTYHEYQEKKKHIGKTTYWYSMIFPRTQKLAPQKSEGIEKIDWFERGKAEKLVGFDNLREVLKRFNAQSF
ncbi:MAG: hypothetical protein BalsKO_31760 [Balneolaceae bacterium]